jgi:hypothetical protein
MFSVTSGLRRVQYPIAQEQMAISNSTRGIDVYPGIICVVLYGSPVQEVQQNV